MKKVLIISGIVLLVAIVVFFLVPFPIVDNCASPCRHNSDPQAVCPSVCEREVRFETLFKLFFAGE